MIEHVEIGCTKFDMLTPEKEYCITLQLLTDGSSIIINFYN